MYRIDDALKEFVESGVAVIVGTGDARGRPHVAYGWGPRVRTDRTTMDVFLDLARSGASIANLRANGRIAVTFAHPVSYQSVQFKGTFLDAGEPDDADTAWVRRHREEFLVATSLIGDPPAVIQNRWLEEVLRIAMNVERAFDQTPGPDAGRPL